MKTIAKFFSRFIATLLLVALVSPSLAFARSPLSSEAAHTRIKRRGLGNWVGVQLQNGTAFTGRIVNIDQDSFGLQLHNESAVTTLSYSEVAGLHTRVPHSTFWIIGAAGVAGTLAIGFVAQHELHNAYATNTPPNPSTLR